MTSFPPEKGATTEEQRAAKLRAKAAPNAPVSSVPIAARMLSDAVKTEVQNGIEKFRKWAKL
jgi:hypothetical protein